jgi:hypothetical protein
VIIPMRRLTIVFLAFTTAAILTGRLARSSGENRVVISATPQLVSGLYLGDAARPPERLDPGANYLNPLSPLSDGGTLSHASYAPWRDQNGRSQIVGRWTRAVGEHPVGAGPVGLIRLSMPDGEILDRIQTDVICNSPPCWYPGTRARVLFAATDGGLYQFAFESRDGSTSGLERQPTPIRWQTDYLTGTDRIFLAEPTWPNDPRLGGRVFVAITSFPTAAAARRLPLSTTHLWSLRLNRAGTAIVHASPLFGDDADDSATVAIQERCPTLATAPDGKLVLAYLSRRPGEPNFALRIAPVRIDPQTGDPLTTRDESRSVLEDCAPVPASFSPEGAWICGLQRTDAGVVVRRVAMTGSG